MPIFFIAAIGFVLLLLFLKGLSQAEPHVLLDAIKWSGITLTAVALILFFLSGRVIPLTILMCLCVFLVFRYLRLWKIAPGPTYLLPPPLSRHDALTLLGLEEGHTPQTLEKAYKKCSNAAHQECFSHTALAQKKRRLHQAYEQLKKSSV